MKYALLFLLAFATSAVAYAGEGDKDKNKTGKDSTSTPGIITIDSTQLGHEIDHDDTLVFEDWDLPDGDGAISRVYRNYNNGGFSGVKGMQDAQVSAMSSYLQFRKSNYEQNFNIYPNPVIGTLHIQTEQPATEIRIIDLLGNQITQTTFSKQLDVYDLAPGTYFIQLMYDDHVESRKFIKSN